MAVLATPGLLMLGLAGAAMAAKQPPKHVPVEAAKPVTTPSSGAMRPAPVPPILAELPATPAPPGSLAGLTAWAGCPPVCPAAAGRLRLRSGFVLQFPPLRAELERLLGRRALPELLRLAEAGPPVQQRDGWLRVALCRQEHCATQFLVLFVQPEAGELVLCWHEERWVPHQLRWADNRGGVWRTGAAGRQPLPPEGCNNRGPLEGHDWDLLRRLADG